ncbi:MFS transporter [Paraburkholderia sp. SIMBA_055]|jgi:MHS family proline/betaine transporter-like MFS transporter|uniref:Major facilitator superfamily MFS_1 n=1 Tax=Paraburkholderia graminis (strain ATCC 700544 / DSM 17151 / LMG 18924 / NCIMB 13744 / C4D1M) TaxID=396598 RepID=B1FSB5_PARG4|nr:MFS transporter [Paraburkholderia graminis]EDT12621.1 major facilitator superfamily MFS_1 [Paraburkholderia graminis C4D1M]MDR6475628.1 MHS family proline/betaine transporter-like MFS transporter [Paraburkholderia graminis]CAB3654057.1 Proline/betaine transporter [Paraburkholderia graminis C4D1M]
MSTDTATAAGTIAAPASNAHLSRLILATSIGNALEFYDLVVYGYFATVLSRLFFPAHDKTVSLLLTLGTFALSYLARPVGALVLGSFSDRKGRKASLTLSIALMTLGTGLVALMPPYAAIGVLAPIGIFASRLLQGFSAGGEFGSSTAFLIEHAPQRKGFMASWQFSSQGASTLLASAFGAVLTSTLTQDQLEGWGWRIPFLFGMLIGPVGLYIRRRIDETPEFERAEKAASPVRELLATQKSRVLVSIGTLVLTTTANYMLLYMPTYASRQLGLAPWAGFVATLLAGFIMMVLTPIVGHWSDKVGRTRIMLGAGVLFLVTVYPAFMLMNAHPSLVTLLAAVVWVALLKATYFAPIPALMSELFPTRTRTTGMALGYNIGTTVFGGFTPLAVAALIAATGNNLAPGLYLMLAAVISLGTLIWARARLNAR